MNPKIPYVLGGAAILGVGYLLYRRGKTADATGAASGTAPAEKANKSGTPASPKPQLTPRPILTRPTFNSAILHTIATPAGGQGAQPQTSTPAPQTSTPAPQPSTPTPQTSTPAPEFTICATPPDFIANIPGASFAYALIAGKKIASRPTWWPAMYWPPPACTSEGGWNSGSGNPSDSGSSESSGSSEPSDTETTDTSGSGTSEYDAGSSSEEA